MISMEDFLKDFLKAVFVGLLACGTTFVVWTAVDYMIFGEMRQWGPYTFGFTTAVLAAFWSACSQ